MTPEQYQRVRDVYHSVAELPIEEQAARLAEIRPHEPDVCAEVEALLARTDDESDAFGEGRLGFARELVVEDIRHRTDLATSDVLPERIGPYEIVRHIGAGGMGVVYEARQQQPTRRVALKVLRPELASQGLRRRFRYEAELLGRLHHPGIAHIYEAGVARLDFGEVLYFAMEFVEGSPLTTYVRRNHLSPRRRLELFARVCNAVHHAHQQGVIHRDLKPANILVDAQGRPKVLDFGIARTVRAELELTMEHTTVGQIVGTLPYMSPEQISGDSGAIDTRSDVYALGVVLYEVLAERLPYEVTGRSIAEAAHVILNVEPARIGTLQREYRGDVEIIVSKAMEKEKERRYQSAAEMAGDIGRHLANEPLVARPSSAFYHLRKFTRRNKGLVAGVVTAVAALAVGLVLSTRAAWVATAARDEAQQREEQALHAAYRASIAAAASALENHDVALARRSLDAAPSALRQWEWRLLENHLDKSTYALRIPDAISGARPSLVQREGSEWVLMPSDRGLELWDMTSGEPVGELGPLGSVYARSPGGTVEAVLTSTALRVRRAGEESDAEYSLADFGLGEVAAIDRFCIDDEGRRVAFVHNASVCVVNIIEQTHEVLCLKQVGVAIDRIALASDGRVAVAMLAQHRSGIWDPTTGLTRLFENVEGMVRAVELSPDGRLLALGMQDSTVRLLQCDTEAVIAVGHGHRHAVTDCAWSPDGRLLATVSLDRTLRIWDTDGLVPRAVWHGHDSGILSVGFSADGAKLVTLAGNGTVRVWDTRNVAPPDVLVGHTSLVFPVAFSADGSLLASAGWDHTVRLWDVDTRTEVMRLEVDSAVVDGLTFSPDDKRLAALADDNIYAWDLASGKLLPAPGVEVTPQQGRRTARLLSFLDDSIHVVLPWSLGRERVQVWNTSSGEIEEWPRRRLTYRGSRVCSPDGRYLAMYTETSDGKDAATPAIPTELVIRDRLTDENVGLPDLFGAYAFCTIPDGTTYVAARALEERNRVGVWQLPDGAFRGWLEGHTDAVYDVAWSPDGARLATAGRDTLRVWDAGTLEELVQLRGHTSFVWSVAFSPDGQTLASGSGDGTVRLWSANPPERPRAAAPAISDSQSHPAGMAGSDSAH